MFFFGLFMIAGGIFAVVAAALDWDFFMNHRKAALFVSMLGRGGARLFYIVLGLGIAVAGVLFALGIIKDTA